MRKKTILSIILLFVLTLFSCGKTKDLKPYVKDTEILGMGGCCALFFPEISKLDENLVSVTSDMGGIYISQDKGKSFLKNNLNGRVYARQFDPVDENVIYAGGSGIYKSNDKGKSFELIFPKKEDIYKVMTKEEINRYFYYTYDNSYPTYSQVKEILVNPYNNNIVYALFDYYSEISIYKSEDKGETFDKIITYDNKYNFNDKINDGRYNKLYIDPTTQELIIVKCDGIYKLINNTLVELYRSNTYIIDVCFTFEDNKLYYIVIEYGSTNQMALTKLFYTSDFINFTYLEDLIINNKINNQLTWDKRVVEFKLKFENVTASSINNIYVTNGSDGYYKDTLEKYPYQIDSIIRIKNDETTWVYGLPSITAEKLENRGWIDGCYDMFGICVNPNNPESFLFTTLCGVYYAYSNDEIYQCYTNSVKIDGKTYYSSTGIDCQTTYGIRKDPFNTSHMVMLNTDLGLSYSYDSGKTWNWSFDGVEKWRNTLYDAHFDLREENVLYGLWSSRHDAPYDASGNEYDNRYGGFAISYDGGITWDSTYSKGIPENAIPVKMSTYYENEQLTIYVATFNLGFYVSYDSGKTFVSINNGIIPISYGGHDYIFGSDITTDGKDTYAVLSKTNFNNEIQSGKVYKLKSNLIWEEIKISEDLECPRQVCIKDGKLYISAVCNNKYNWYTDITKYDNVCGGVYEYYNSNVKQIFDEKISVAGLCFLKNGDMVLSDICGNVYYKKGDEYIKIYSEYHMISKGITVEDDILYLPTLGGGLLKIELGYK